jgi:hypothetical protein
MAGVEERVEAVEREVMVMREEWRVIQQTPLIQARVLNALRETQIEQRLTLQEHSQTLSEHGQALKDLRETQLEQGQILKGHGLILHEHGQVLHELRVGVAGIVRSLDYLINEQGRSPS